MSFPGLPCLLCRACLLDPYCCCAQRAINTMWSILEKTDLMWIPVVRSWRLNERHYGALQVRSSPHRCRKMVWFVVAAVVVANVWALKAVLSSLLWWWLRMLLFCCCCGCFCCCRHCLGTGSRPDLVVVVVVIEAVAADATAFVAAIVCALKAVLTSSASLLRTSTFCVGKDSALHKEC